MIDRTRPIVPVYVYLIWEDILELERIYYQGVNDLWAILNTRIYI